MKAHSFFTTLTNSMPAAVLPLLIVALCNCGPIAETSEEYVSAEDEALAGSNVGSNVGANTDPPDSNAGSNVGSNTDPPGSNASLCAMKYQTPMVCAESNTECTFYAQTADASCGQYCAARGGTCLGASHDLGGGPTCDVEGPSYCDEPAGANLCTCTM